MENVANVLQTFQFDAMPHYIVLVVTKLHKVIAATKRKLRKDGMRTVFCADWHGRGEAVWYLSKPVAFQISLNPG